MSNAAVNSLPSREADTRLPLSHAWTFCTPAGAVTVISKLSWPGVSPLPINSQVRLGSTLSQVEREIAVIAVSREKDARYEWAAHVRAGRTAGMREEVIEAVRHRADVSGLDPDERDIVMFVRQLLQTNKVEQPLFDVLVLRHSERWVVELAGTVGQYQYISAINNTFEVEPAADADQLPV